MSHKRAGLEKFPNITTNALLDGSIHTDTAAGTVVRGDLIYGNSTPAWARLGVGSAYSGLWTDGTDASWSTTPRYVGLGLGADKNSAHILTVVQSATTSSGQAISGVHSGSVLGPAYAVVGNNTGNSTNAYGVYGGSIGAGTTNYALYGTASGAATNWGLYVAAGNAYLAGSVLAVRGISYTWPAADGAASTFLQTNGSGTLSWAAAYRAGGTDVALADGGTGASLSDPNADRIFFWDDSAGATDWLAPGNSIAVTTTTLDTIQDIRTTATPQWLRLGLGQAAAAAVSLSITVSDALTTPIVDLIQSSTGDTGIRFAIGSVRSYILGVDNSDSDNFKISQTNSGGAVLGTSDLLILDISGNLFLGAVQSLNGASFNQDITGSSVTLRVNNLATAANTSSNTLLEILTGAAGGDAWMRFVRGTSDSFALGSDMSADTFVLAYAASASAVLGTGNLWSLTSDGHSTWSVSDTATTPFHDLIQSSTGDAGLRLTLSGGDSYSLAIDNSATNNPLAFSYGSAGNAAAGTNDLLTLATTGILTSNCSVTNGFIVNNTLATNATVMSLNQSGTGAVCRAFVFTKSGASTAGDHLLMDWRAMGSAGGGPYIIFEMDAVFDDNTQTSMDSSVSFSVMNAVNAGNANTTAYLRGTGHWESADAMKLIAATQAEQETGTAVASCVTPGRQHFHQSAAKFWVEATAGNVIETSYNVASTSDVTAGTCIISIATDFSGVDWCCLTSVANSSATVILGHNYDAKSASAVTVRTVVEAGGVTDPSAASGNASWSCAGFGDQ